MAEITTVFRLSTTSNCNLMRRQRAVWNLSKVQKYKYLLDFFGLKISFYQRITNAYGGERKEW